MNEWLVELDCQGQLWQWKDLTVKRFSIGQASFHPLEFLHLKVMLF
jgi:hypothetical protein